MDSCHRKRVSLTRNLDPAGPKSDMSESEKVVRESYTFTPLRVFNEKIIEKRKEKNFCRVNNRVVPCVNFLK